MSGAEARSTGVAFIGAALRMLREQKERSQSEVAAAAGVTKAMLSAFERQRRRPSLASLDRVLAALDAHLADLAAAVRRVEGSPAVRLHNNERRSP